MLRHAGINGLSRGGRYLAFTVGDPSQILPRMVFSLVGVALLGLSLVWPLPPAVGAPKSGPRTSSDDASLIAAVHENLNRPREPNVAAAASRLLPADGVYRPATIYFGAYRRNEPLADHPEQWKFVQKHADGFLLHFGFWLNNDYKADPIGTAKKLAPVLKAAKFKTIIEVGFPSAKSKPGFTEDMGRLAAKGFVDKIKHLEANSGMVVDEIECELRLGVFRQVLERHPDFSANEVMQQVTGKPVNGKTSKRVTNAYWPAFLATTRAGLGDRPINVGCPPVYVPWKGLFNAGSAFDFPHPADLDTDGKPKPRARILHIETEAFWQDMLAGKTNGFLCDSPWYLSSHPVYVARGMIEKTVDFERFVHVQGKHFTFIVNNGIDMALPEAEWDRRYVEESMKSLYTFQLAGGRAERYALESWYVGPYTIVPEDRDFTYTNLVKRAILYVKGPGQRLSCATHASEGDHATTVIVKNEGIVPALPAIRVRGEDLTVEVGGRPALPETLTGEGATPPKLLAPGDALTVTVSSSKEQTVTVEAMWNPQDPSGKPRATVELKLK